MKAVTIKVVFDRKHISDTKTKKGLVQIRVTVDGKQVFLSTGIKVFKNQWDAGKERVKNSMQSSIYNNVIDDYLNKIIDYRDKCARENIAFDFERMKAVVSNDDTENFLSFMEKRITERKDIRESTRKTHKSALSALKQFGGIVYYSDLTFANIRLFDDWLRGNGVRQTTVWSRHKLLKTYINEAIKFGKVKENPYLGFKVNRGKSEEGRYITEEEMKGIMQCKLPASLEKVRDLMIVEFYTGLAVSDLMRFDLSKIMEINGHKALLDTRKKTDEHYYIMLFEPVLKVLEKYHNKLPSMTMQQYNMRMKVVADYAGIDKPKIASPLA